MVHKLSTIFSHIESRYLFQLIEKMSKKGHEYLLDIPAEQWRSTSWRDDPCLPPRYGVVTSNMSESTNSMFEGARAGSWLFAMDYILGKMMERITVLQTSAKKMQVLYFAFG